MYPEVSSLVGRVEMDGKSSGSRVRWRLILSVVGLERCFYRWRTEWVQKVRQCHLSPLQEEFTFSGYLPYIISKANIIFPCPNAGLYTRRWHRAVCQWAKMVTSHTQFSCVSLMRAWGIEWWIVQAWACFIVRGQNRCSLNITSLVNMWVGSCLILFLYQVYDVFPPRDKFYSFGGKYQWQKKMHIVDKCNFLWNDSGKIEDTVKWKWTSMLSLRSNIVSSVD